MGNRRQPPRPVGCNADGCTATIIFLPSQAHPDRKVCANLPAVRQFVAVLADDDTRLADQAAIDAGRAVWRNVLTYSSHHAEYKAVPPCPGAADYRRGRARPQSSTTSARKA